MKEGLFSKIIAGPAITFSVFFLIFTLYHSKDLSHFVTTTLLEANNASFQNQPVQNPKAPIITVPHSIAIGQFDPTRNYIKIDEDNSFVYLKAIQHERLKTESNLPTLKLEINKSGKTYWETAKIQSWEKERGIIYFEADVVKENPDLNQFETFYAGNYQLIF